MLFKNNTKFELTPEQVEEFKQEFKLFKFPIRFKYGNHMYHQSKDNDKPDRPRSVSIPWMETVNEKNGVNVFRYAESADHDGDKKVTYYPHREMIHEVLVVNEYEIEKLWFLLNYSKHIKDSKNASKSLQTYFIRENKQAEARAKMDAEKEIVSLKSLLYGDSLKDDEINDLAKKLFIDDSEELSRDEIIELVISSINIAQNKSEQCLKIRNLILNDTVRSSDNMLIQDAIDYKVVHFSKKDGAVFLNNEQGKPETEICKVRAGKDWKQSFADYLQNSPKHKDLIKREVEDKIKSATASV